MMLTQFEGCNTEDLCVWELRDRTEHHSGAAENLTHPITRSERQRIAVSLRNVEENWLAGHSRAKRDQERLRHDRVCSEKRADLVAGPARPHHRIAAYLVAI